MWMKRPAHTTLTAPGSCRTSSIGSREQYHEIASEPALDRPRAFNEFFHFLVAEAIDGWMSIERLADCQRGDIIDVAVRRDRSRQGHRPRLDRRGARHGRSVT